jgi:hypothetical protein
MHVTEVTVPAHPPGERATPKLIDSCLDAGLYDRTLLLVLGLTSL